LRSIELPSISVWKIDLHNSFIILCNGFTAAPLNKGYLFITCKLFMPVTRMLMSSIYTV